MGKRIVGILLVICAAGSVLYLAYHFVWKGGLFTTHQFTPGILAPARAEGKGFGFIDTSGQFVIAPAYDQAYPFSEGLALVRKGNLWGFIDKAGIVVIPVSILTEELPSPLGSDSFRGFSSGRFLLWNKEHGTHYIDKTGSNPFAGRFSHVGYFVDGKAVVRRAGEKGVSIIDPDGNVTASFEDEDVQFICQGELICVDRQFKKGYIGWDGNEIVPCMYDYAGVFSNGLCLAINEDGQVHCYDRKTTLVFSVEEIVFNFYAFHDGYCALTHFSPKSLTAILIDKTGRIVLDKKWRFSADFTLGLWAVQDTETEKWGYVDIEGNWVIEPQFTWARPFTEPDKTNVY
ncbi:MAG: WG repeat-containing protein [Candidatus Brocadiia bacterium]